MRAYKFLAADRRAVITGFVWPPSAWVEATGRLQPCRNGIHACRIRDLPHWIGARLWAIEIEGEVQEAPDGVLARRGRLLAEVHEWAGGVAQEFADDCARRAQTLAGDTWPVGPRAADAVADARDGWFSASAYIAAAVAGQVLAGTTQGPSYERHFLSERARQAAWLQKRLGLTES